MPSAVNPLDTPLINPPIVVTVAAHDPLGGAGVAADLTTFAAMGAHGMVALTAVTAQRLDSVDRVEPVAAELLAAQLDGIIAECRPAAMKVGLLLDAAQVAVVAERVADGRLPRPVVDPVMVDGRGKRFVAPEVQAACRHVLFPLAAVLTPNRAEATLLAAPSAPGNFTNTPNNLADHAELAGLGAELVVVTGGGPGAGAIDLLVSSAGDVSELRGDWVETANVRGTGCTFAAAIAAGMAHGLAPVDAAVAAKAFVTARLVDGADWSWSGGDTSQARRVGPVSHRQPGLG
jgi:hydroxymethylpyrimidine/phosphomethylpyrimidine kinase